MSGPERKRTGAARGDGRTQRAEAKRHARRSEILRAAVARFSRQGFHATSVSDVIGAAGISRGTFYLYFDSKEVLFLELMDDFIRRIREEVRVVDPKTPNTALQILENVRRVVDLVFDQRDLAIVVLRENRGVNPEIDERLQVFYGFLQEMVEGALSNGRRMGLIRAVDESLVATALIGGIREVFFRELVALPDPRPDRETIAETLFEFGMGGLRVAP